MREIWEEMTEFKTLRGNILNFLTSFFIFSLLAFAFPMETQAQGFTVPAANGYRLGNGTNNSWYTFDNGGADLFMSQVNGANATLGFWFWLPEDMRGVGTTTANFEIVSISGTGAECNTGYVEVRNSYTDTPSFSEESMATTTGSYTWTDYNNGDVWGIGFGIRNDNAALLDCHVHLTSLVRNGVDLYEWYDELPTGGGGGNVIIVDNIGSMTSEWECTVDGDTTNCVAIATSTTGLYNGPNFQEWLFIAGIIIFLLSYMFWGRISFTNLPKDKI